MPADGMIAATGNGSSARPGLGSSIDYPAILYGDASTRKGGVRQDGVGALLMSGRSEKGRDCLAGLIPDGVAFGLQLADAGGECGFARVAHGFLAWNIGGTMSKHSGDFPVIVVTEFTGIALLFPYFPIWH